MYQRLLGANLQWISDPSRRCHADSHPLNETETSAGSAWATRLVKDLALAKLTDPEIMQR